MVTAIRNHGALWNLRRFDFVVLATDFVNDFQMP
jgi:hypothetical protein